MLLQHLGASQDSRSPNMSSPALSRYAPPTQQESLSTRSFPYKLDQLLPTWSSTYWVYPTARLQNYPNKSSIGIKGHSTLLLPQSLPSKAPGCSFSCRVQPHIALHGVWCPPLQLWEYVTNNSGLTSFVWCWCHVFRLLVPLRAEYPFFTNRINKWSGQK